MLRIHPNNKVKVLFFFVFIFNNQLLFGQLPNYVPKTDLIAWMPFSGNSKDVSANANSNTVNGATLSTDRNNISNESYSFDGVDDYIELGGISSKLNASKGLTMSAWILWGGSGGYVFLIAPKPNGYITIGSDSTIGINVLNCNCSTDIDIKHKIKPNQWYHIALTYDISQGKMSLYCDGKLISTKYENIYSYYSMNGSNSRLGNYYFNNHYFKGKIDEVGLWNRELNSCEINLLFLGKNVDPEIKSVPAKKVTYKSAILSTLVNSYLDTASLSFEYGLTTNYGQSAFVETISQSCSNGYYSKQVENLLSGKLYHYRVKVKTSSKTYYGEDQLLTTGSNFGESESSSHNVFLGDNGIVYAVGDNSAGQLGDNSKTSKNVPIKVLKGEYDGCKYLGDNPRNPIISVGSGAGYTLALALDGTLYSFGDNTYGQLGINSTTSQITPVRVLMGEYVGTKYIGDNNNNPIVEISCGEEFIAVVDKQGLVYSWGRNTFGQLGDNSLTGKKIPVKVRKGTYSGTIYLGDQLNNPIVQIEAGDNFCIAQSADGLLYAWGSNSNGQLGDNTLTDRTEPIIALKGSYDGTKYIGDNPKISITNISAGGAFSSCVLSNGRVLGWGKNDYGQLGCNSTTDQKIPVNTDKGDYSGISFIGDKIGNRVIQVVNGNHFKLMLTENGNLFSVGLNANGQLGLNSTTTSFLTPKRVLKGSYVGATYLGDDTLNKISNIAAGGAQSFAVLNSGLVFSCGFNDVGQLAIGSITNSLVPAKVKDGISTNGQLDLIDMLQLVKNRFLGDDISICNKDSIRVSASAKMKSYSWNISSTNQTITIKKSGIYECSQTDSSGCIWKDTIVVSILNPKITPRDTTVCKNSNLSFAIKNSDYSSTACSSINNISNGLIAWYPFCGNANDYSTNKNNGTVNNGALLVKDRFGNPNSAYFFDGINDYISATAPNTKIDTMTISVWVKNVDFSKSSTVMQIGNASSTLRGLYITKSSCFSDLGAGCSGATSNFPSIVNDTGRWNHFVFVNKGVKTDCYFNNKFVGTINNSKASSLLCNYSTLYLGVDIFSFPEYFKGYIDDYGMWNRALSVSEISNLYSQNIPLKNLWSNGDTSSTLKYSVSVSNKIWVKVTDGISSCYDTTSIKVLKPTITIGKDTIMACGTDSLKLSATSGFQSYLWSNGKIGKSIFIKQSGYLTITGTDSFGCKATDSALISILNPKINPEDTVVCNGGFSGLSLKNTSLSSIKINSTHNFVSGIYTYHIFYNDSSIQITNPGSQKLEYLILGGGAGGSGGKASVNYGAGGAGGNIVFGSFIPQSGVYNLKVGRGGTAGPFNSGSGGNGGFSSIFKDTAWGGSGPSFSSTTGGSNKKYSGGTNGGYSFNTGGGAGAGGNGYNASGGGAKQGGKGGDGFSSNFTGKTIIYGGGGAGGIDGLAQINGGGGDASNYFKTGGNGLNTRGGGGGGGAGGYAGGAGGSGIVIIRYLTNPVTTKWSTGDTTSSIKYSTSGKNKVWVRVSDGINQCSDTTTVSISNPKISITGIDSVNCFSGADGSIVSMASGGISPYTYKWNDAFSQTTATASNLKKGVYKLTLTDAVKCVDTVSVKISEPAKVTLAITAIDSLNCYQGSDGSITTSISGGSNGYKYTWNDATKQTSSKAINLKKGTYKVIAKDIYGCSDSISGTVNEPAKVTLAITAIDSVNCYQGSDGSITTSISGGSNGYKYTWNDATKQTSSKAINLKKGTYKVIAKDIYGCSDSISGTVNEPAKVTLAITAIDSVNCYQGSDGSITTSISGGSKGYKYTWNDATKQTSSKALNLKKGTYKVIAKDIYGCSDSISGTVNEPAKVVVTITNIDSAFCFGYSDGSITTSTVGGSNGYKYLWNDLAKQKTPKATKLSKGTYKIIVKDIYGCSDSISGTVNEPAQIVPKIMSNRLTMQGMTHEIYADIIPAKKYNYSWKPTSLFFGGLTTEERPKVQFAESQLIRLDVTDYKGCKGYDTATITVVRPLKSIMPTGFTPNSDNLNDGFGLPDVFDVQSFEVFDRWGGMVFKGSETTPRWDGKINGEFLPSGVYTYTIQAKLKGTDQIVKYGGSVTLIK